MVQDTPKILWRPNHEVVPNKQRPIDFQNNQVLAGLSVGDILATINENLKDTKNKKQKQCTKLSSEL
jgi:hypothetical protein